MNNLLRREDFWTDFFGDRLFASWPKLRETDEASFMPKCDVIEEKEHFALSMDLPGIPKEDVKIEVKDGFLTVSGMRKNEESKTEKGYQYFEKQYGSFQRSFRLGDGLDGENIHAEYDNGVLKINIGKRASSKSKLVPIKGKESSAVSSIN